MLAEKLFLRIREWQKNACLHQSTTALIVYGSPTVSAHEQRRRITCGADFIFLLHERHKPTQPWDVAVDNLAIGRPDASRSPPRA